MVAQAQLIFTTNNGSITIMGRSGSPTNVVITRNRTANEVAAL